ncbi:uncharacterized protein [Asterias amurensis]|uniref:uncharacterized protein n=1 Tax=Asterias amurensis TaxID=7602 RepID=UPI003AB348AA
MGTYSSLGDNLSAEHGGQNNKRQFILRDTLTWTNQKSPYEPAHSSCFFQFRAVPANGLLWPSGVYGLPTPTSGCPNNSGVIWETGSRLQDTENEYSSNYWSTGIQLLGPYERNDMTQNFCMKTRDHTDEAEGDWPQGRYCVFKYGPSCPKMMSSGFIFWNDEDSNNHNEVQGIVPSGVYDQDTRIDYCCMTDGDVSQPISLPTQNPFYLFPYNSEQCQAVQGMNATQEYFRWDEEDIPTSEDKTGGSHPYHIIHGLADDNIVHYCHYEAIYNIVSI